jgi:hypothetical protein
LSAKTAKVFMKFHIFGIVLGAILAVPTIVLGGSVVSSLIQGKAPSEAISILGEQLDGLFGRVSETETKQIELDTRIEKLEAKIDPIPALSERELPPEPPVEMKSFTLDSETREICEQAEARTAPSKNSVIGNIQTLCERIEGEFETKEDFEEVVENIHKKWKLLADTETQDN